MIDKELLALLRNPADHGPLSLADDELIEAVNRAIGEGRIRNRMGDLLESPIDGGLVSENRELLYPILEGLPMMVVDEAILLEQLVA